jgi:hypothetical protein
MLKRLKFEIDPLVNDMLDKIPLSEWESETSTFLDPAMGGAQCIRPIINRLRDHGHSDENIKGRVSGIENNQLRVNFAVNKYNLIGTYMSTDFLSWETDMKFDVIVTNPPYLKRGWLKFIKKAIELNPTYIVTINPDPLNNKSDFGETWKNLCIENGLVFRKNMTDYFPDVSSGRISGFVLNRTVSADTTLLKSDNPIYDRILEKVTTETPTSFVLRGRQDVSGYGNKSKRFNISDSEDEIHPYQCIMSCTKDGLVIKYSDKKANNGKHVDSMKGRFIIMNRFFGKNNPDPLYIIDDIENYNVGYDCMVFKLNSEKETLDSFRSVYGSKVYRLVMNHMRNGGFDLTQGNLMRFRRLDLEKIWTDHDIYNHFGLTQEEIDYIESNVK